MSLDNALDFSVGHLQRPADILDCGPRGQGSKRDDLADAIAAVKVGNMIDYFAAPTYTKIDVDIGHRDTAGVKESLEDKVIV